MHLPLTRYGLPQVVIYPLLVFILMLVLFFALRPSFVLFPVEILLFLVLIWMFSFFRDPLRNIIPDEKVLYSPADGTITDIVELDSGVLEYTDKESGGHPGRALRIGMFLSVFNVHINRAPCAVRIEKVTYKKGQFINAMSPESSRVNESNDVLMTRLPEPRDRLLVRQVSGAIARHIVCEAREAAEYSQGEPFGMIKFGSRTELYLPVEEGGGDSRKYEVTVKIGDRVRAGLTPLVRYLK